MSYWGSFTAVTDGLNRASQHRKDSAYQDAQRARETRKQDEEDAYRGEIKAIANPRTIAGPMPIDEKTGQEVPRPEAKGVTGPMAHQERAAVAEKFGRIQDAEVYRKLADTAEKEGAIDFFKSVRMASPDAESIKAAGGIQDVAIPADALAKYDAAGTAKVPPGTRAQAYLHKRPDGTEAVDIRFLDPDGKVRFPSLGLLEDTIALGIEQRATKDRGERTLAGQAADRQQRVSYQDSVLQQHATDAKFRQEIERARLGMTDAQFKAKFGLEKAAFALDQFNATTNRIKALGVGGGQGGIDRKEFDNADSLLKESFQTVDPTTGAKSLDFGGFGFSRQLAQRIMAGNGGDGTGAAVLAKQAYDTILQVAGGDKAKAQALMQQELARANGQQVQDGQGQQAAPGQQAPAQQVPQPRVARPQAPVDPVRAQLAQAQAEFQRWGSRQRQADPAGFERARQALAAAEQAAAQSQQAPELSPAERAQISRPSFRLPSP